jgi:hypothetical protein
LSKDAWRRISISAAAKDKEGFYMSYATPLKLFAGLIIELGGFGLILFGVPLLLARFGSEPKLANVADVESEWAANYHPAPPALFVPPPRSAMVELGRPRIVASQLRSPGDAPGYAVSPFPAAAIDNALEPLPQEKYVARTLDAAGQRLVNAVGGYFHQQVHQVFVDPRGNNV